MQVLVSGLGPASAVRRQLPQWTWRGRITAGHGTWALALSMAPGPGMGMALGLGMALGMALDMAMRHGTRHDQPTSWGLAVQRKSKMRGDQSGSSEQ